MTNEQQACNEQIIRDLPPATGRLLRREGVEDIYHMPLIAAHDAICDDRRCDPAVMGSLYPQVKAAVDVARAAVEKEKELALEAADVTYTNLRDQYQQQIERLEAENARCWALIRKINEMTT